MAISSTLTHPFGWPAARFELDGIDGKRHSLETARGRSATLVMFICNHCPYVKAVINDLVSDCAALGADGVGAIAIMPNDTDAYPADSFGNMKEFAVAHRFGFPYVIDRDQSVARAYGAACTPDFFGFDRELRLRFRGRMYEMAGGLRKKPGAPHELRAAMRLIATTGEGPTDQTPSMGCSIKWRG